MKRGMRNSIAPIRSASMQKRTSPLKFAHLAEKSGFNSVPTLSTKARPAVPAARAALGDRPAFEAYAARAYFERA